MDWPIAATLITATTGLVAILWRIVGGNHEDSTRQEDNPFYSFKSSMERTIEGFKTNQGNLEKNMDGLKVDMELFKKDTKEDFRLVTGKIDDLKDILIAHCNHKEERK